MKMARLTLADLESVRRGGERECGAHAQPDESYDVRPGPSGYFKIF
jgi:hypothetical protein